VEDGLIALVTSYHKGYSCSGITKIIHRYPPPELGELLVYYLWLVLPFLQKLDLLSPHASGKRKSSFLWPEHCGWNTQRLTAILRRETEPSLKAGLTISTYRHVAIALSRRHLQDTKFKKDYDAEDKLSDQLATHGPNTAGRLCARSLEEAPEMVESKRKAFWAVSRKWHEFLGVL
jgi:hypothetical protein